MGEEVSQWLVSVRCLYQFQIILPVMSIHIVLLSELITLE